VAASAVLCHGTVASAQAPPLGQSPPASDVILSPVLVTAPPPLSSSSEQLIPGKDFEIRPQGRPADVLRLVPGLVIGQHQGGGKAEQYLIRGFDADHGTDLAIFVDGLPVNLRSHAHGQGYVDLHFLTFAVRGRDRQIAIRSVSQFCLKTTVPSQISSAEYGCMKDFVRRSCVKRAPHEHLTLLDHTSQQR
jgi:hypothetical protein